MVTWNWEQVSSLLKQLKDRIIALRHQRSAIKNDLVGLDIGADSLKLLRIDTSANPPLIKNFAIAPLPAGSIIKDEVKNVDAVSTVLKEMLAQSNIETKNIAIAIPRSIAIIKTILVSAQLTEEEIESRAWIEVNRHFPDLVGDIYLDFTIIEASISGRRHDDPLQNELILVACRREQINPYLEIIEKAKLIPKIVDVNCYALERALMLFSETINTHETVALLNLNTTLSSLIVVHKGKMIHAHDESFEGQHLLNQISEYLRDKSMHGEQSSQDLADDELYNAILRNNLISHLRHIVQFIYSSHPDLNIEQIILSGDCASIPALATFTKREIGTPSIIADPFLNMRSDHTVDQIELRTHSPGLMLCTGLALSKIQTGET